MARSRKSSKASGTSAKSAAQPGDAKESVSAAETVTEILTSEEAADTTVDARSDIAPSENALEDGAEDPATQESDVTSGTDAEIAAETDGSDLDDDGGTVEAAEADAEGELYGESEIDQSEDLTPDADDPLTASGSEEAATATELAEEELSREDEKQPDPAERRSDPVPSPQVVRGSVWPGVIGGVLAALVGFVVGRGDALDSILPKSLQRPGIDMSAVDAVSAQTEALTAQAEALEAASLAQQARLDALEEVSAATVLESVSGLQDNMAAIAEQVAALEARPVATETAPDPATTEAVAALEAAVAEQRAQSADLVTTDAVAALEAAIEEQRAQIAALVARAEAAEALAAEEASRLLARAAATRVVTAVDSGGSFAPALSDLTEVTPVEVPDALKVAAEAGVPTLVSLQDSFPDAARSGLAAARSDVPESEVAGLSGFLRRQLNTRSLTPREGDDPDAILSRAQAAVRAGDLGVALAEMEALPDSARSAMSDWLEAASARKAAQDAARDLADSLNSN